MGYGYGIWLVYDQKMYKTEHLGHITLTCFMKKPEAKKLFDDLSKDFKFLQFKTDGVPVLFSEKFYPSDKNRICSWGYNYTCNSWNKLKDICENYECDFSHTPHTSIEYGFDSNFFIPKFNKRKNVKAELCLVDIRSDFPVDWKIIESIEKE